LNNRRIFDKLKTLTQDDLDKLFGPLEGEESLAHLNRRLLMLHPEERLSAREALETLRRLRVQGCLFA